MKSFLHIVKNNFAAVMSLSVIVFSTILYILRVKLSGHYYGNTDFFTFYQSMRFYFSGQNIYSVVLIEDDKLHTILTKYGDLNPPFLTILLLPLYFFNYAKALEIWTMLSLLSLFINIKLVLSQFKKFLPHQLAIIAGFLVYMVNSEIISYGQISNFLLLLVVGCWILGRNHKDIGAGILIAIACSLKLFCGLFLVYFLIIRRFKLFISAVVTGIFLFILTFIMFGIKSYIGYLNTLVNIVWYAESWSVSFKSFMMRLMSPTENNYTLLNFPHLAQGLATLLSVGLLMWLVDVWIKLNKKSHDRVSFDLGFSLTLVSMLLISPLGWTYYFNLFIIPYLLLVHESDDNRVHLACCFLLFINSFTGDLLKTYDIKTPMHILYNGGIGFYVIVLLLLLLMKLVYQKTRQPFQQVHIKPFISVSLWWVIYGVAFVPSIVSQCSVIKNMVELSTKMASA
jgi:alpha-1,2-mannosyltransferase